MAEIIKPNYENLWASAGAVITPSAAKISLGWTAEIPPHQWQNWWQYRTDRGIAYLMQHGIPEWDATSEYYALKSVVNYAGSIYIAVNDSVNSTPPSADWRSIAGTVEDDRVGQYAYYATLDAVPSSAFVCDGALKSRTVYARLFAKIGTTFGAGDGSTTFALPNFMDGKFIRSVGGNAAAIGVVQAFNIQEHSHAAGTLSADTAGAHTHTVSGTAENAGAHTHPVNPPSSDSQDGAGNTVTGSSGSTETLNTYDTESAGNHTHSVSGTAESAGAHSHTVIGNTSATGTTETRPYNMSAIPVIFF